MEIKENEEFNEKKDCCKSESLSYGKEVESKSGKINFLSVFLVILLVVALMQAFQLNALKNDLSSGSKSISVNSNANSGSSSSGKSVSLKKNLQNLPSMVGGC